ncbi:MAG: SiaB family protein kinase [Bacteroidales bacterium]|nr:SiaB family protein kinase [Bacteroidales bacterium]
MFKVGYDNDSIISFKGPLTVGLLSFVGNSLKSIIRVENSLAKRIFRIFIELTQNVSYYSAETIEVEKGIKSGVGWFIVKENSNKYNVTTGNLIIREDGFKLIRNCDEINSLTEKELRELKRRTRSQAIERDVGAHIGLIQTSLLSGDKLNYKVTELDDIHSFFTISVNIKK